MILQDPWTIRHPYICRFLVVIISFVLLLLLLVIPSLDQNIKNTYSGTILTQITVYSTMLFIRFIPLQAGTIFMGLQILFTAAVFALPQLFYSYHIHRKPRETQAVWIFLILFIIGIWSHAGMCIERFDTVLQYQRGGYPVSEKDLYENAGKPVYWRKDYTKHKFGFYTNGCLVTYIKRDEHNNFEIMTPYRWID